MTSQLTKIDLETLSKARLQAALPVGVRTRGLYVRFFKRVADIVLVLLASPIFLPLITLLALIVVANGGKPFYTQERVGKNGRHFRMWKLRSMVHDADELLADLLLNDPDVRREWESTQKLKKDPRITPVGRFLRKTSLDELPQLLNVLNGTMSLVGPRPMMPCQQSEYDGTSYYRMRPGVTGLWQISDRNESEFVARVHYDDLYNVIVSPQTDMRILAKTVGVVLRCTGY